jgi:mannose-6-phosphate isomerase-like protein (cupin superfamily)
MKEVKKPWGNFKQFTHNELSTVKILTVKPKQRLSLQYHHKREEMWYFLSDGYAQIGKKEKKFKKGEIVKIKKEMLHRLFSKDKEVIVLEVSFGNFDENDIVRVEDIYGRK